jgi:hypothetical protein
MRLLANWKISNEKTGSQSVFEHTKSHIMDGHFDRQREMDIVPIVIPKGIIACPGSGFKHEGALPNEPTGETNPRLEVGIDRPEIAHSSLRDSS